MDWYLPLKKSKIVASHKTLLFQSQKIYFLPHSLRTQKELRSSTKKLVRKKTSTPARSQANSQKGFVADWNAAYTLAFKCTKSTTLIECFHSRGQHLCKFIGTKESVYIRKEFNSQRTGLVHQHGRRFIVWPP